MNLITELQNAQRQGDKQQGETEISTVTIKHFAIPFSQ